ncbi:MAG: gluconate 2-dehydrogenase subunit 3 family protein [Archangiaceae bacterium]|nr:gluconate 2-dehydrogenase subunit 3 family protein [Archangiaceae bacterium]
MPRRSSSLKGLSRRVFVHRLAFMGGGVILLGSACTDEKKPSSKAPEPAKPGSQGAPPTTSHLTFTNEEFAVLSAAVDRILPRDEDPGALDANVHGYIDAALQAQQLRKMKEDFTGGLHALDRRCGRMHKVGFAQATPEQQDDVLKVAFKEAPESSGEYKWYDLLVTLTMEGFLGDPSYGGNKNKAGWKLMGFDLVGKEAGEVSPDYDGKQHLDHLRCGSGKGC